jgi:hypothetical protein
LHLYCRAPAPGADTAGRSWVLRVQVGAKRRDIGLGPYPEVTLSEARQRARETKAKIRQGIDPAAERRALKSALIAAQAQDVTFAEVAQRFYEKKARELKTATQATRLRTRLDSYAIPALGHLLVRDIDRAHIIECLRPIWETKTETAQRARQWRVQHNFKHGRLFQGTWTIGTIFLIYHKLYGYTPKTQEAKG